MLNPTRSRARSIIHDSRTAGAKQTINLCCWRTRPSHPPVHHHPYHKTVDMAWNGLKWPSIGCSPSPKSSRPKRRASATRALHTGLREAMKKPDIARRKIIGTKLGTKAKTITATASWVNDSVTIRKHRKNDGNLWKHNMKHIESYWMIETCWNHGNEFKSCCVFESIFAKASGAGFIRCRFADGWKSQETLCKSTCKVDFLCLLR